MDVLKSTVILKQSKLKLTDGRKEILAILQGSVHALSHTDIEKKLLSPLDRITVYRTLQSFMRKGLIHAVTDPDSRVTRYLYNSPGLSEQHAHFKCRLCKILVCLDTPIFRIMPIELPGGYHAEFYSLIIEGFCDRCRL